MPYFRKHSSLYLTFSGIFSPKFWNFYGSKFMCFFLVISFIDCYTENFKGLPCIKISHFIATEKNLNFCFFKLMINVSVTAVSWGNKVVKHSWIPLNSSTFPKVLLCAVAAFLTVSPLCLKTPSSFQGKYFYFFKFCKYYERVVRNLIISHPGWSCKPYHFWILIPYPFPFFFFFLLTFCFVLGYSWLTMLW